MPLFSQGQKGSYPVVALWVVFWPFLESATYPFVQPLGGSSGTQDAPKMMGKDLTVTLASSVTHKHCPFGPMHRQDLSSLNNPQVNPQPLLAATPLKPLLLCTEVWETLLEMSHLRNRGIGVLQPYLNPLSLWHITSQKKLVFYLSCFLLLKY